MQPLHSPCWDSSVVFVPTSRSDGREFKPGTRSQPAHLGETVEQQDYVGPQQAVLGKFPALGSSIKLTFYPNKKCVKQTSDVKRFDNCFSGTPVVIKRVVSIPPILAGGGTLSTFFVLELPGSTTCLKVPSKLGNN